MNIHLVNLKTMQADLPWPDSGHSDADDIEVWGSIVLKMLRAKRKEVRLPAGPGLPPSWTLRILFIGVLGQQVGGERTKEREDLFMDKTKQNSQWDWVTQEHSSATRGWLVYHFLGEFFPPEMLKGVDGVVCVCILQGMRTKSIIPALLS